MLWFSVCMNAIAPDSGDEAEAHPDWHGAQFTEGAY